MCRRHTPLQQLKEARQIALDYGCYLAEKKDPRGRVLYLLFRRNPNPNSVKRGIYLGRRGSPAGILAFVHRVLLGVKNGC
jgi:hypothetical protein